MWAILLTLLVLAAVLDAFRDTVYSHFSTSIFSDLNPKFWKALVSWMYAKRLLGYPVDAWHLAKSGMLCIVYTFMGIATAHYYRLTGNFTTDSFIFCLMAAVIWIVVFDLFYDIIFRKK